MKIVIFSGTSDGRLLSGELVRIGADVTVSVATEYGRAEQERTSGAKIITGRLDKGGMISALCGADLCIDATHPYAVDATKTIRSACLALGIEYKRLKRKLSKIPEGSCVVRDVEEAVVLLKETGGNILITTGAKELNGFKSLDRERLYPRVLPSHESLEACDKAGIPRRNIIAMQGPFSAQLNAALIRQFRIKYLVTKDGGERGGFNEKAEAAMKEGVRLIVITPPEDGGEDYDSILEYCRERMK